MKAVVDGSAIVENVREKKSAEDVVVLAVVPVTAKQSSQSAVGSISASFLGRSWPHSQGNNAVMVQEDGDNKHMRSSKNG